MFSPIFPVKKGLAAVNSSPIPGLCLALWAKRKPQKQAHRAGRKMVKVKSKTYKPHERAPRGTHKKAELNDAMKADGERMRNANDPARLINGSLEVYRENFPASQIWPKLVSHFAGQAKQGIPYSLVGISDWNIDMHQPSHKVISGFRGFRVEVHSTMMEISVNYEFCKRFLEKRKEIDGFRVTIITLFPDFINNEITILPTVLPVKPVNDEAPYVFFTEIPTGADSYLICFKADPCEKGIPNLHHSHPHRVMRILRSGKI